MSGPTTAPAAIRQRVAAGAAWLDQHQPDWLDHIDLITLDMSDPYRCVLGQLYDGYGNRPDDLGAAADLGFHHDPERDIEHAQLTQAWRDYVLDEAARRRTACCPCRGQICDPGCTCPDCPHDVTELTDDD